MKNIGSCLQEGQRFLSTRPVFTFASVLSGVRTGKQPVFSPRLRTRARAAKGKVWGEGEATRFERK